MFLLLGIPLLLCAVFYGQAAAFFATRWGGAVRAVLTAGYALFLIAMATGSLLIARANANTPPPGADAVIVLGAGLYGEEVTPTLKRRLDAALAYLADNPGTLCVLSGGQGPDEDISEAEAMRRYVTAHGLQESRIRLEARSRDTHQNIAFSRALLMDEFGREPRVVVVTSDFHLFRGLALARGAGFADPGGIGERTRPILLPVYTARETIAIMKDWLLGRLA